MDASTVAPGFTDVRVRWTAVIAGLFLLVSLGTVGFGRASTLLNHDWADSRLFAYMGQQWLFGHLPYKDLWDNKPPGIFAVMALAFADPRHGWLRLALIEAGFQVLAIGLLFRLAQIAGTDRLAASIGCLVAAVVSTAFYPFGGGYTELFVLAPASAAILCGLRFLSSGRTAWACGSGLCVAVATQFKLPGLAAALALGGFCVYLLLTRRISVKRCSSGLLFACLGFAAGWLPSVLYFAAHGCAKEMLRVSFLYPFLYGAHSQKSLAYSIEVNIERLQLAALPLTLGAVTIAMSVRQVMEARQGRAAAELITLEDCLVLGWIWLAADLAGALAGGRSYQHYYVTLASSLGFVSACGFSLLAARLPASGWSLRVALALVLASPLVANAMLSATGVVKAFRGEVRKPEPSEILGHALRGMSRRGDTLFVWDYLPNLYELSGLTSASKYTTAVNLADYGASGAEIFQSLMTDLARQPPVFLVIGELTDDERKLGARNLAYRNTFERWIGSRYVRACAQGPLTLFVREGTQSGISPHGVGAPECSR
jgi:hypothetical protein